MFFLNPLIVDYALNQLKMKKTEYFISIQSWNQYEKTLKDVKRKRDQFITSNKIVKIVDEDIKIQIINNSNMLLLIKLTYYLEV